MANKETEILGKSSQVQKIAAKVTYHAVYDKYASSLSIDEMIEKAIEQLMTGVKKIVEEKPEYQLTEKQEHELQCLYRQEMKSIAYL